MQKYVTLPSALHLLFGIRTKRGEIKDNMKESIKRKRKCEEKENYKKRENLLQRNIYREKEEQNKTKEKRVFYFYYLSEWWSKKTNDSRMVVCIDLTINSIIIAITKKTKTVM